jgi:hypothetical protein
MSECVWTTNDPAYSVDIYVHPERHAEKQIRDSNVFSGVGRGCFHELLTKPRRE